MGVLFCWVKNWLVGRAQRVLVNRVQSNWQLVTSSAPQDSVLEPVLFYIFIRQECQSDRGQEGSAEDLDRVDRWAKPNCMTFRKAKCQALHLGDKNLMQQYGLGQDQLESCLEEDLRVLVNSWLNMSQECTQVAKKAIPNGIMACIRNSVAGMSREITVPLNATLVRSRLKYRVFLSPSL